MNLFITFEQDHLTKQAIPRLTAFTRGDEQAVSISFCVCV